MGLKTLFEPSVVGWRAQVVPVSASTRALQQQEAEAGAGQHGAGAREVVFMASLDALAFAVYTVRPVEARHPHAAVASKVGDPAS